MSTSKKTTAPTPEQPPDRNWVEYFEQKINEVATVYLPENYRPQRIRDHKVIRDALWGFNVYLPHEISVIDSPLFQRLRGILQTSLAHYTYPSATHNRFQHSLGTTALAERVINSLEKKQKRRSLASIAETQRLETRLAALLHDLGHGPFSHGTEEYFKSHAAFDFLRIQNPQLFKASAAGEILSYFLVSSTPFKCLWGNIVELYPESNLHHLDLNKVALMILGRATSPQDQYLAQIINGPFDVDKLDYLLRDGYYTGLHLDIDIDRLLLALEIWKAPDASERLLAIDLSGASALEQLLFSKMVIFTSVYHHHKVRSTLHSLFRILDCLLEGIGVQGVQIADPEFKDPETGKPYPNPFSFLLLDDHALLTEHEVPKGARGAHASNLKRLNQLILDVKQRRFLKRALVLSPGAVDEDSAVMLARLQDPDNRHILDNIRQGIADASGESLEQIIIDVQPPPRFEAIASEALVKVAADRVVKLEDAFPTRGWVTGYAAFKNKVYVLSRGEVTENVAKCSLQVLKDHGISVTSEAFEQAKHRPEFIAGIPDMRLRPPRQS